MGRGGILTRRQGVEIEGGGRWNGERERGKRNLEGSILSGERGERVILDWGEGRGK